MQCKKCRKEFDDTFKFCPHCGAAAMVKRRAIKRVNGTGTVYKRTDVKSNPWVAVTPAKKDLFGEQKRQIIGHYPTAQAARDALEDFRRNPTTKLNITVEQVYKEWSRIKFRTVGAKQVEAYTISFKKLSDLYDVKFRELRTAQMQSIIDDLSVDYSLSALQKIKVLLGQLYQYAMQNDIVNKNYAEFIVLPKEVKSVKPCFTAAEVDKLKRAAENDTVEYADMVLIMCYTGHRIGEFLTLKKSDVIYDGDMIFLRGGNKTAAGRNKVVPVSPIIKQYVERYINRNGKTLFCDNSGNAFTVGNFRNRYYYRVLEKLNLPKLSPHATRRTFSTRLAAAGVREEEVAKMMGHTDYGMDIEAYINPENKTLFEAIKKLS